MNNSVVNSFNPNLELSEKYFSDNSQTENSQFAPPIKLILAEQIVSDKKNEMEEFGFIQPVIAPNLELTSVSTTIVKKNSKGFNSSTLVQKYFPISTKISLETTTSESFFSWLNQLFTRLNKSFQKISIYRKAESLQFSPIRLLKKFVKSQLSSVIEGEIYSPKIGEVSLGKLVISGVAVTKKGKLSKIEAFIEDHKIGEHLYGVILGEKSQNRKDKSDNFAATLNFNPDLFEIGLNTIKIKVTNSLGQQKDFSRLIIIGKNNELSLIKRFSKEINPQSSGELSFKSRENDYLNQISKIEPSPAELDKQRKESAKWNDTPLISLISPIYQSDTSLIDSTIKSVINQSYENWELYLICNSTLSSEIKRFLNRYLRQNPKIKLLTLDNNFEISKHLNEGLKLAQGEFVGILHNHDELAPNALFENVLLLKQHPQAEMIYSDEDTINLEGIRSNPHFKPDWSPDFFYSSMYTNNFCIYRRSLMNKVGGFRPEFETEQVCDLVLRLIEKTTHIFHIPKVLYHQGNNEIKSKNHEYAIKALSEHFKRINIEAEVNFGLTENLFRIKRKINYEPKISIIIPTSDKVDFLENCINSIQKHSTYRNYEIIVVDNNSSLNETLEYFEQISNRNNIKIIKYQKPFNFSAINNFAANHASGELLLFLNNDTEVISKDWLESMVEHAIRPEVGAVGARLLYFNETIQHAGIITGISKIAGHSHKYYSRNHAGYFSRAKAIQNVSAVTGACLMMKNELFKSIGGFNQEDLPVAFNDIDLCLRIKQQNLLIVYTPYSELYHYESASRGSDQTKENSQRFQKEIKYMLEKWGDILKSDPYYNPNLTLEKEDFSMAELREIKARAVL
ncbi:MAG TPA: glycosyltransferase family 2 protein [Pyrinomonadaceae bacterium]|nr:glycosyltransferase family 2 protein [Pyrinomonadaceae bacterium]